MKKLGIFGGSFSPPHKGHRKSALAFYDVCSLDELLIMPAGIPPHKNLTDGVCAEMRFEMTKLAFAPEKCGGRNISVSDYELKQNGKSFSYLTVSHFSELPDTQIYLLVGSDMFLSLDSWKHPEILLKRATVVLNRRETDEQPSAFLNKKAELEKMFGANILLTDFEPLQVSSSILREKLKKGEPTDALLDSDVANYIRRNELYRIEKPMFDERHIQAVLPSLLSQKRLCHVRSVADEAERMGKLFDLSDEQLCVLRKAALLHDITHEKTLEEQLSLIKQYQIPVTKEDLASLPVIHQFTGAWVAKEQYGLEKEGVDAIACHTTGKPFMTLLDKILCLADYTEPTREYPSCQLLRRIFYDRFSKEVRERLIDEVMLLYLEKNVEHLNEKGAKIHHKTWEALNYFKTNIVKYEIV